MHYFEGIEPVLPFKTALSAGDSGGITITRGYALHATPTRSYIAGIRYAHVRCIIELVTGSIARSANLPVCNLLRGRF